MLAEERMETAHASANQVEQKTKTHTGIQQRLKRYQGGSKIFAHHMRPMQSVFSGSDATIWD
jgi:hypothetical protein